VVYNHRLHPFGWRDIKRILDSLPRDPEISDQKRWELILSIFSRLYGPILAELVDVLSPVISRYIRRRGPLPWEPGGWV